MCGICGIYSPGAQGIPISTDLLCEMAAAIAHRGPDDVGTYLAEDGVLGFGFRRLSIIDVGGGHQPMANEDSTIWIVFNGEIYNHVDLRPDLERRGHRYRTRCDTETIIHLYEEYGLACVDYLRGMFAFAIWDGAKRQLVLARDRLGIKPLYYACWEGQFTFGSEIKALLRHPAARRAVDPDGLSHYLTYGVVPAPRTMFAGIFKLEPGQLMVLDHEGAMRRSTYWDALPRRCSTADPKEAADEVCRLLGEAVRLRMMSDVPFGAFLSGGIDSSSITAFMSRAMDRPVDTFTIGFDRLSYDERSYARLVATALATNHHEEVPAGAGLLEMWPDIVFHQDEPIGDQACYAMLLAARMVRQAGVTVVQVGEGSDELFAGYDRYTDVLTLDRGIWPLVWAQPPAVLETATFASQALSSLLNRGYRKTRYLRGAQGREQPFWGAGVALALLFDPQEQQQLMTARFRSLLEIRQPITIATGHRDRLLAVHPDADRLDQISYVEIKIRLAEMLLMRVDKMTMAASVEARVPFLDHKLVEFVLSLPTALKIGNLAQPRQKWLLKQAVHGLIPDTIIDRPKQGFVSPVGIWFQGELRAALRRDLSTSPLFCQSGWFHLDRVLAMVDRQSADRDSSVPLWALWNLVLWHRHWIERS